MLHAIHYSDGKNKNKKIQAHMHTTSIHKYKLNHLNGETEKE